MLISQHPARRQNPHSNESTLRVCQWTYWCEAGWSDCRTHLEAAAWKWEDALNSLVESQLRWLQHFTCEPPGEALLHSPLGSLLGHFRVSPQRLLQGAAENHWRCVPLGALHASPALPGQECWNAHRNQEETSPPPAVSLQRPLLTKPNLTSCQLARNKCFTIASKQWKLDLELRSNKLITDWHSAFVKITTFYWNDLFTHLSLAPEADTCFKGKNNLYIWCVA